ncbi:MAG: response regulator transcription factor [Cyanobacteria bacterium P01_F01_bin.150]
MSLTILVADDDLGIRVAISDYLELSGYLVTTAADGQEALAKLEQELPHLLIADINMPRLNGHELVKRIRRRPLFRLLPVIFLTERTSVKDRVRGYEVGCDVYLPKPFNLEELSVIVRSLLERSQLIETEWRMRMQLAGQHEHPRREISFPPNTAQSRAPVKSSASGSPPVKQPEDAPLLETLTSREEEVLGFLSQGLSNNQIGEQLFLSPRTIEKHVSRLLRKTDTHNRAELLRFAIDHGLVGGD